MKKFLSVIATMLTLTLMMSTVTFAANDTDDSVVYNGRFFKATELSQETLDWLEWYNGLSDDLKEMVSHEPLELELASPTPYTTTTTVDATALDIDIPMPLETSLLPTSGYEPVYNPNYWNKDENIRRANCYAYAMDVLKTTEGKLQPGDPSGKRYTSLTKSAIEKAVKADGPYLGSGREITNSSKNATPGKNQYKVALVIAPNSDYHWYVQNRDGYWSHKQGYLKVSNVDASGKKITDPQSCDRNYGSGLNYSTFCGYYLVKYTNR